MYETHPNLPSPPDDTVLWRYMDFTKFVSLLEKSALFFCRADLLGDPFEGSISPASPAANPQAPTEGSYRLHAIDLREIARLAHVSCWHAGEFESEAMWRLYAREKDGIGIRTDFSRFRHAFVGDQAVHASTVQYRDYRTASIPFHNGLLPLFHKRMSFEHEREVRALVLRVPSEDWPIEARGRYCEVDLAELIGEIVVAPFAEDWFFDLVHSVAGRYGLGERVRASTLSDDPTFTAHLVVSEKG